jgi:two-component system phosphate regulon sensor histidine kinase PhoR
MVNLLSNAIKFSPDGSKIKISVAERKNDMEVQVQDQGAGIAVDALTKIFDRFEQAAGLRRDQQHGAGLGLAICKMIVEAHRGTIGVDSIIGQGSKFWFRIPRSNEVTD